MNVRQLSFAGGEITPSLYGRVDQVKYATGLRTCRNFQVMRHGGVANRAGTRFIQATKGNGVARLLPFDFDGVSQTYALELGDHYIRFYSGGGVIVATYGIHITAYDNAAPYTVADLVLQGGIAYYCRAATTGNAPPNATYWYPLTTFLVGGVATAIVEIPTPYLAADLFRLKYTQSADIITLAHPSYPEAELARRGHTRWTLTPIVVGPTIAPPTAASMTATGGTAGSAAAWAVTRLDPNTGEESLPLVASFANVVPTTANPTVVQWATPLTGFPQVFRIYRARDTTTFGYVGTTTSAVSPVQFRDDGQLADYTLGPPTAPPRDPFAGTDHYPAAVGSYQQRRLFGGSNLNPETVFGSQSGRFANFNVSTPLQDDDAVTFTLAGKKLNRIRHLLDVGRLLIFTTSGVTVVGASDQDVLTPSNINPRQKVSFGASEVPPLIVGNAALYVQARGSIVRDLTSDLIQGDRTEDLTIFAAHLVDGYTIVDWAYAETPHSILWAVRSDGVLLGLTYLREQQLVGWHRHDTDGAVESVCVIPEGTEDAVYLVVRRVINGATVRYIERMESRTITPTTDLRDVAFVDANLPYDGRNKGAGIVTLSGGVSWSATESLTLTADASLFTAGDVGNAIVFYDAAGAELLRLVVDAYVNIATVTGRPSKYVPVALRGVATTAWGIARRTFAGLTHLEGKAVSVFADASVVASPNNPDYAVITVSGGAVTLPHPVVVVHIGLPYTSDLETLDIDTPSGPSVKTTKILINRVKLLVEKARGGFAGRLPDAGQATTATMDELKWRDASDAYGPIQLRTGEIETNVPAQWNGTGRVAIRQVDPLPLAVLAIIPQGFIPSPQ